MSASTDIQYFSSFWPLKWLKTTIVLYKISKILLYLVLLTTKTKYSLSQNLSFNLNTLENIGVFTLS